MAEPLVHVTLATERRQLRVYAAGSSRVRVIKGSTASVAPNGSGADVSLEHAEARYLVEALAAAIGYYPVHPDLDAQRDRVRELAAELREVRTEADEPESAELADLALARHVGHHIADAAGLLLNCRDQVADRTVAEMLSELVLMADALQLGTASTNPEARAESHYARIQWLRERLPQPGTEVPSI